MVEEKIKALTEKYQTPFYVFDSEVLQKRVEYLKASLPSNVELCYAVKANTFIIKEVNNYIDRFEVCSPGEEHICERLNIPMNKLVISGVYKTPEFIERLVKEHDDVGYYTIESIEHFNLLLSLSKKYGRKLKVLIRLTSGNQFGLNKDLVEKIIKENQNDFDIAGIQYFSGTQKHSIKRFKREIEKLDDFMQHLEDEYGYKTAELEYGTGFQVTYFEDEVYNEDELLKEFSILLQNMKYKAKITLELGRSVAASCGTYLTKVVDKKTNKKQNYAIVDGGMNHIVYFGQSMAMRQPIYNIYPNRSNENPQEWNICGSLCTSNDILVKQLPIENLQIGDVLAFNNAGAYCMIEGISLFLSRDLPAVIILKDNGETEFVRDYVPTDILNTPNYERKEK